MCALVISKDKISRLAWLQEKENKVKTSLFLFRDKGQSHKRLNYNQHYLAFHPPSVLVEIKIKSMNKCPCLFKGQLLCVMAAGQAVEQLVGGVLDGQVLLVLLEDDGALNKQTGSIMCQKYCMILIKRKELAHLNWPCTEIVKCRV